MNNSCVTNCKNSRFVGKELLLWLLATVVGVVAAAICTYFVGGVAGFYKGKLFSAVVAVTFLSLTWGSWGALLWTRRPAVRRVISLATQAPALWMVAIGAFLLWTGGLTMPIILTLVGGGVGLAFVSRVLSRSVRRLDNERSGVSALLLTILHPLFSAFAVSGFLFLWTGNVLNVAEVATSAPWIIANAGTWALELTLKTVLAVSLISTIIPAFVSEIFSRMLLSRKG